MRSASRTGSATSSSVEHLAEPLVHAAVQPRAGLAQLRAAGRAQPQLDPQDEVVAAARRAPAGTGRSSPTAARRPGPRRPRPRRCARRRRARRSARAPRPGARRATRSGSGRGSPTRPRPSRCGRCAPRRSPRGRSASPPRRASVLARSPAELYEARDADRRRARAVQARARAFVDEVLIPLEEKAERAHGRLPAEDVERVRRESLARGLSGGLHSAEHGGQGWSHVEWYLVEEQFGRSTNAISWHIPTAYNVLAHGQPGADRPLPAARAARRGPRRLRRHRGARRLGPVGDRDDRRAHRRRLADPRREVVRDLRRRRLGLHRHGQRAGRRRAAADAVPRRPRRRPASRSSTTRRSRTAIRTGTRRSASTSRSAPTR